MVSVIKVLNVLITLAMLFCICEGFPINSHLNEELNYINSSSNSNTPKYLTSDKCDRNERTRVICKLLSKSQKFKKIEKYLTIRDRQYSTTTASTISVNDIKRRGFPESEHFFPEDKEENGHSDYGTSSEFSDEEDLTEPESFRVPKIYKYPSLTKPKGKNKFPHLRMPRMRQLRPFKMKKFRNIVWPKVLNARNKLAEMPIALAGIPVLWTVGVALMLKHQINQSRKPMEISVTPMPPPNTTMVYSEKLELEQKRNETREKFLLVKEVVSLTGESLNLAANKIDFLNNLAKSLKPFNIGAFLSSQGFNANPTLINKMKSFRGDEGNMTNLVGEFVRVMAEQAIRNATDSILLAG